MSASAARFLAGATPWERRMPARMSRRTAAPSRCCGGGRPARRWKKPMAARRRPSVGGADAGFGLRGEEQGDGAGVGGQGVEAAGGSTRWKKAPVAGVGAAGAGGAGGVGVAARGGDLFDRDRRLGHDQVQVRVGPSRSEQPGLGRPGDRGGDGAFGRGVSAHDTASVGTPAACAAAWSSRSSVASGRARRCASSR